MYHVIVLVEKLSYLTQETCIYQKKVVLYILTTFPHKLGSLAFSVYVFKNIHRKMKSLNVYEMLPTS